MFTMILLLTLFAPQTGNQAPAPAPNASAGTNPDLAAESSPFTGDGVSGDGRLCNGYLRIYPRDLDWETTDFSCHHTAYETIKQATGDYIYRLHPWSRKCGFRILIVHHASEQSESIGWEATGYTTEAAWRKGNASEELDCGAMF